MAIVGLHAWIESDIDDCTTRNIDKGILETKFDHGIGDADITLLGISAASIANKTITVGKMYGATRGSIFRVDASNVVSEISAKSSGYIVCGDGTDVISAQLSGDASLSATGALTVTDVTVGSDATGDIQYKSSPTALTRLGIGSASDICVVNAMANGPAWTSPAMITVGNATTAATANDVATTAASDAIGDIIYRDAATTFQRLAIGTAGQILQCATGTPPIAPQWSSISGDATIAVGGALTIANSAITSAKIADGTIVNADISTNSILIGKVQGNLAHGLPVNTNYNFTHRSLGTAGPPDYVLLPGAPYGVWGTNFEFDTTQSYSGDGCIKMLASSNAGTNFWFQWGSTISNFIPVKASTNYRLSVAVKASAELTGNQFYMWANQKTCTNASAGSQLSPGGWQTTTGKTSWTVIEGNVTTSATCGFLACGFTKADTATDLYIGFFCVEECLTGGQVATVSDLNVVPGIPIIHRIDMAGGATATTDITLKYKLRVTDVMVVNRGTGTASDTLLVGSTGNAITNAMDISGADKTIARCTTIDDGYHEIAAGGILRITETDGGGSDSPACSVYVHGVIVA